MLVALQFLGLPDFLLNFFLSGSQVMGEGISTTNEDGKTHSHRDTPSTAHDDDRSNDQDEGHGQEDG